MASIADTETQPMTAAEKREARAVVSRNWIWFALLGAALVIGGLAAVALPVFAGVAVTGFLGAILIAGGVLQGAHAFGDLGWRVRAWSIVSALVYLVGGALMLLNPFAGTIAGTIALSLLMLAIFLADGLTRIAMGLRMRPERGWGWLTATGAIGAALAVVIMVFPLPGASLTLLGVIAGAHLMLEGWAFIFLAFAARPESDRAAYPYADDRATHSASAS